MFVQWTQCQGTSRYIRVQFEVNKDKHYFLGSLETQLVNISVVSWLLVALIL